MAKHLPVEPKERKRVPLYSGLLMYFPDALVEVARLSQVGNEQHNPGQPLHWAREKSTDQEDTLMRHLLESGSLDTDGVRHSTKVAWRALAKLQLEIEEDRKKSQSIDKDPGPVVDPLTTYERYMRDAFPDRQLVRPSLCGTSNGEWTKVSTDQADGCASDAPTRHEVAAHKHRLQRHLFNGDGDRNG